VITADNVEQLKKVDSNLNKASLAAWVGERDLSSVLSKLRESGIGAAPSLSSTEVYTATMKRAKGAFGKTPTDQFVKAFPYQLNQTPLEIWCDAPKVGEHNLKYNLAGIN